MALSDLLWACPACGEDRGLVPEGRAHRCRECGTLYRRARGAAIEARAPDGSRSIRRPAEWLALLPDPETVAQQYDSDNDLIRSAMVSARRVQGLEPVRGEDGYLNHVEVWGEAAPGRVELHPDRIVHVAEAGNRTDWPLGELTAVQASSSALQLNRRGAPLLELSFTDDSVFLWERLLHAVLRDFYGRTGRGEIVEFQPRIVTA